MTAEDATKFPTSNTGPGPGPGPGPRHHHRLWLRRRTRIVVSIALGLVAGVCATGVYVYLLTTRNPEWFGAATDIGMRASGEGTARAREFENQVLSEFSKVRAPDPTLTPGEAWRSEPWAIAMDPADINTWLEHQGPRWAENLGKGRMEERWPAALVAVRVSIAPDQTLRVGALVRQDAAAMRTYAMRATPEIRADGLWLTTHEVEVGQLAVRAPWVLEQAHRVVRQMVPADVRDLPNLEVLLDAASGTRPLISSPVVRLADRRRVRILELRCEGERVVLTCQTEGAKR